MSWHSARRNDSSGPLTTPKDCENLIVLDFEAVEDVAVHEVAGAEIAAAWVELRRHPVRVDEQHLVAIREGRLGKRESLHLGGVRLVAEPADEDAVAAPTRPEADVDIVAQRTVDLRRAVAR